MPYKRTVKGFGFVPVESENHFLVTIPSSKKGNVQITEHLSLEESFDSLEQGSSSDDKLRVVLPVEKWEAIASFAMSEFNRQLRDQGLPPSHWKVGRNPVSRLLGKELVLLAWAIEDADPGLIPVALRNWKGLASEERWWLFTMTNAATGHAISGRNKGWRKAERYAITENPVSESRPEKQEDFLKIVEREESAEEMNCKKQSMLSNFIHKSQLLATLTK